MTDQALPNAVRSYLEIDLTPNSPINQALMQKVQQEASAPQITLTTEGDTGSAAEGLTPAMSSWFQTHIEMKRRAAIAAAETHASSIMLGKNTPGELERVKIDAAKRHRAERTATVLKAFRNDNAKHIEELDQAAKDFERLRFRENKRKPKVPNRFVEWGLLLPAIMIPEGMLNYESFKSAPIIQSGLQAAGATIIVGIGIAIAAHLIGIFIRQFSYFMKADDGKSNNRGIPNWSIGSFMLIASLAVVGYARYYYLLPLRAEAELLGQVPPNVLVQTSSLLLGNIVVFAIGVGLTFMLHDSNPDYSDAARTLKALKQKDDALRNKQVNLKVREIERKFKEDSESAKIITDQMSALPAYAALREVENAIEGKDREVVGLLNEYKSMLVGTIQQRQPGFEFVKHFSSGDRAGDSERISINDFGSMNPQLLWS